MLDNKGIDAFCSWFLKEYSLCITEPELADFMTVTCFNKKLGILIGSFGYEFVKPFLDGSLHLNDKELRWFEKNCPLDSEDRETLNNLLYGHLTACEFCRHTNSVHVYNHLAATQPTK